MFKRMGIIGVIFCLLLTMAACGTPTDKGADADKSTNTSDKVKLKIAFFKGGYGDEWILALKDEYEKVNKNVEIVLEPDPDITAKIGPRLETGANLPDIAFVLNTFWQQWALKGYLEDLSDLYQSEIETGKTMQAKMQPGAVNMGKINDKYWMIPWNDGVTGIVYNSKMFEENGWAVPKTMKEMNEVLIPQIKAKGIKPFAWGGKVITYWDFPVLGWWTQYEGVDGIAEFLKMDNSSVYGQQGRLKALEEFEKIISDPQNSVDGAMGMDHIQSQMAFVQGKAAMIPNGAWIEHEMQKSLPEGFVMKMMKLPTIEGAKDPDVNNTMAGDLIIIPKNAKNKDIAKDFLKFMTKDEMLVLYSQKTGSPRPFVYDTSKVTGGLTEFGKSVFEIWSSSKNVYFSSQSPIYYRKFFNWPAAGAPYARIVIKDDTAQTAFDTDVDFANSNWEATKAELGMK